MAPLFGAGRTHRIRASVPEHSLLLDALTAVEQRALPRELRFQCALDRGKRVHVLDLGFGPEGCLARPPRADVRVDAQTSLLHVYVAHADVLELLFERAQVRARFDRRSQIRLAHDLDERYTGSVEVHG